MKIKTFLHAFFALAVFSLTACSDKIDSTTPSPISVGIKDGSYFINGEKTFINAIGYEIGARPGQHPYEDDKELEIARMRNDLKLIKEAGFNGVRTWSELTEEEVQLIQESGLMLVYGIWILPDGEFNDPQFVADAKEQVHKVMEWSKNYDCIITYLIMNEPMVAHCRKVGAQATFDLWTGVRDIIHAEHPGIPVTISNNSVIGEYINERIFDVYGYNTYDYEDGIPNYIQDFSNHFRYLKEQNGENKPVLVTEFGMSVSPNGYGMYGGNTRKRQASHIISNFREVLDAGVAGICPFYYADGWWKANEPGIHNPEPEEWFGYWGYKDDQDTVGYPRPIWHEFTEYNQAILALPGNHQIYTEKVPVEVYLNGQIARVKAIYNDGVVYDKEVSGKYLMDYITFDEQGITDRELVFEFYDIDDELVKYETIMLLTSKDEVELPQISVALSTYNFEGVSTLKATYNITNNSVFKLDNTVQYLYAHHIVWNSGEHRKREIDPSQKEITFTDSYDIPEESDLINVGVGITIKYGKFTRRIHDQKFTFDGDWADPIRVDK